jgi:hypothetical protein
MTDYSMSFSYLPVYQNNCILSRNALYICSTKEFKLKVNINATEIVI